MRSPLRDPIWSEELNCWKIPLGGKALGTFALVDSEDLPKVRSLNWWTVQGSRNKYPYVIAKIEGAPISMHRLLFGDGVDHVNRDGLDNRRANIRTATPSQNAANRRPRESDSGMRGVYWEESRGKWRVQIRVNNKIENLGRFTDKDEAVAVHHARHREVFGEFSFVR